MIFCCEFHWWRNYVVLPLINSSKSRPWKNSSVVMAALIETEVLTEGDVNYCFTIRSVHYLLKLHPFAYRRARVHNSVETWFLPGVLIQFTQLSDSSDFNTGNLPISTKQLKILMFFLFHVWKIMLIYNFYLFIDKSKFYSRGNKK